MSLSFSCHCIRCTNHRREHSQQNESHTLIGLFPRKECMSVWSSRVGTGSVTWLRPERLRRRLGGDRFFFLKRNEWGLGESKAAAHPPLGWDLPSGFLVVRNSGSSKNNIQNGADWQWSGVDTTSSPGSSPIWRRKEKDAGTQRTKTIADWCILLRVLTCTLIGLFLPKQKWWLPMGSSWKLRTESEA